MKHLLQSANGYTLYAQLNEPIKPSGMYELKITSTFDGAKHPSEERTVHQMFLTKPSLERLVGLLSQT